MTHPEKPHVPAELAVDYAAAFARIRDLPPSAQNDEIWRLAEPLLKTPPLDQYALMQDELDPNVLRTVPFSEQEVPALTAAAQAYRALRHISSAQSGVARELVLLTPFFPRTQGIVDRARTVAGLVFTAFEADRLLEPDNGAWNPDETETPLLKTLRDTPASLIGHP